MATDHTSDRGSPSAATPVRMADEWCAQMIAPLSDKGVGNQSPYLSRHFDLAGPVEGARLRISALGLYRCFINGTRVGNDVLTPGWTSYWNRLSYQTYDVSDLLKPGANRIEIWLGDGWFRSPLLWKGNEVPNTWGARLGTIAEIVKDGEILLKTDSSWQSGLTPIVKSGIYFGENYDARLTDLPADKGSVALKDFDPGILVPHEIEAVQELDCLEPVSISKEPSGSTIYDFGQNCAGYVALSVSGEAGAHVLIEHAELVDANGRFDNDNLRAARACAEYTLKGEGLEHYRPHFTFFGYRYARITITGRAEIRSIQSIPISSVTKLQASLSTASPLVDRLFQNTIWSQRSNFIEVPTDCPQRDERLGWTGDAQVFASTACYLHDCQDFLSKWLRDLMADQRADGQISHVSPDPTRYHEDQHPNFFGSTGWGDAICVVPWTLWTHYGDRKILEETLGAMERWCDYLWSISDGPIVKPPRGMTQRGFTFGDWLQPTGSTEKPLPTISDDVSATIYFYISSRLTAKAAAVVGNRELCERMEARAAQISKAFAHEFITPAGRVGNDDQTSYALAILHDLIPSERLEAASRNFRAAIERSEMRIGTGFLGTPALLPALTKIGATDLAAKLLLQEEVPGWLYQVKQGATTIWERWDAIGANGVPHDSSMNSYNHYAYGAVCAWLLEHLAGFRPDEEIPGFRHIVFEPVIIPALGPVHAHHDIEAGRIAVDWSVNNDLVTYDVTIPEGASGTFVAARRYSDISVNGRSVAPESGGNPVTVPLKSGQSRIAFRLRS